MVFAELVHFNAVVGELSALVALVSQQHCGDTLSIGQHEFRVQVLFPLNDSLECRRSRHIEHYEGPHGFTVVYSCHVPKALLACYVPELQADGLRVPVEHFQGEVYADGGSVVGGVSLVHVSPDDRRFADPEVPDDQHLVQVLLP